MKQIRIYNPGPYKPGEILELSSAASQHVGTVLRMHVGDTLTLFSGDNVEFDAAIISIQKKKICVQIYQAHFIDRESPRIIHLAQAISKGDRMEWIVQKAVELGVFSITPLFTEHCVVRLNLERMSKKQSQWQAIAIAACEQSGRNRIPMVHNPLSLEDYLQQCQSAKKWILDPMATSTWRNQLPLPDDDLALLIGPEGGFSKEEVMLAKTNAFQPLRLGPRILRTETATVAALSLLQTMTGDF